MRICVNGKQRSIMTQLPDSVSIETYRTVFYGRGMGIHGTTPFSGGRCFRRF
ncbi:MAG: hypothetical protein U5L72_18325 [Bacteroidales bacterium]|nr:hypothetical protein [Bacteroidales bacterium]